MRMSAFEQTIFFKRRSAPFDIFHSPTHLPLTLESDVNEYRNLQMLVVRHSLFETNSAPNLPG